VYSGKNSYIRGVCGAGIAQSILSTGYWLNEGSSSSTDRVNNFLFSTSPRPDPGGSFPGGKVAGA
jgi:ribulose kinase